MTDKEKLFGLLENDRLETIDEIMKWFLEIYGYDIPFSTMRNLVNAVNKCFSCKIDYLESARFVANERARYIKTYLEGKMWPTEEVAKANVQPQIDNAQAIIDACKRT